MPYSSAGDRPAASAEEASAEEASAEEASAEEASAEEASAEEASAEEASAKKALPGERFSEESLSTEALRQHNQLLYEIVSQTDGGFEEQMQHALARTTRLLGLDQGLLARVEEPHFIIEQCHCPDGDLNPGQVFDLEDVYGTLVLEKDGLLAIDHVGASGFRDRRCYEILGLESYISTPVRCDGALYGTLAFSGAAPKRPPFIEADRSLVRLLGQWVGAALGRRRAENAQRRSEERFRLLAENVSDMVCLQDLRGRCIYASPSSKRLLGYAPEELVGVSPLDLAHPDDRAQIRAAARRVLHGEQDVVERLRLRCKNGAYRWCETAGHPVYADDGETVMRFLTSTRDVSGRVAAEQALERSNAALRRRNRGLQSFAYIASHDLQEPLRKVRAFAGLMREDYTDAVDEDGRYYLECMEDGAERMADLVSSLLDLSRVTTDRPPFERVDLRAVADEVRADLELRIQETDGRVEIGALPTVEADRTQMRQLLQNLIGNGLKFHREGVPPVVEVRAEKQDGHAEKQDGHAEKQDGHAEKQDGHGGDGSGSARRACRLVVEDNGIGFEEKFLDRIFTPLQRLHGRGTYEGTGIGLAVCRRIAERHGGSIRAKSTPGAGSRFAVTLPYRRPEDASAREASAQKASSSSTPSDAARSGAPSPSSAPPA